jgi:hypothetical protein
MRCMSAPARGAHQSLAPSRAPPAAALRVLAAAARRYRPPDVSSPARPVHGPLQSSHVHGQRATHEEEQWQRHFRQDDPRPAHEPLHHG